MGLHFGDHTPSTRGRATPNRGNCIIRAATRRRYTVSQLLMLQTPTTTGMENAQGTESPAATPVSGKSPTTGPKGGPTFGTKLSQHK